MINGLQVDFTTEQLRAHLAAKIQHHSEKADWYVHQVEQLTAGGVGLNPNNSNDPVASLRASYEEAQTAP